MRLQLLKIDHLDGTLDLVWQLASVQYARTVNAADVDTKAKLGAYLLGQMAELEDAQGYILEAHRLNGSWILDNFTGDDERDIGRREIRQLPGWATWTAIEADAWIVNNVTDLASAKIALRAMAKMLIFLRDSVL